MMKKMMAFVLVLSMLIAMATPASASVIDKGEGGAYTAPFSCEEEEEITSLIRLVFSATALSQIRGLDSNTVSYEVRNGIEARSTAVCQMEASMQCVFDLVETSPEIIGLSRVSRSKAVAEVYLATGVTYHYPDVDNSSDFFAYGVNHIVELELTGNTWKVVSDSFDERDVTGVASSDMLDVQTEDGIFTSDEEAYVGEQPRSTFTYNSTKVRNALSYAVTYCGFSAAVRRYRSVIGINPNNSSQSMITHGSQNYNSSYNHPYVNTHDCANFVSQCLYAAGMPTDSTWFFNANNANWVGAAELVTYLTTTTGNGTAALVNSSYSNVYPGNPVFWYTDSGESSNHIMICTGYNTTGLPVVCGHTTDVYRIPVTAFTSAHIVRTVKIANTNYHSSHTVSSNLWYYDANYHYHICNYCEYPCSLGAHTTVNNFNCSVCGALYPYD